MSTCSLFSLRVLLGRIAALDSFLFDRIVVDGRVDRCPHAQGTGGNQRPLVSEGRTEILRNGERDRSNDASSHCSKTGKNGVPSGHFVGAVACQGAADPHPEHGTGHSGQSNRTQCAEDVLLSSTQQQRSANDGGNRTAFSERVAEALGLMQSGTVEVVTPFVGVESDGLLRIGLGNLLLLRGWLRFRKGSLRRLLISAAALDIHNIFSVSDVAGESFTRWERAELHLGAYFDGVKKVSNFETELFQAAAQEFVIGAHQKLVLMESQGLHLRPWDRNRV